MKIFISHSYNDRLIGEALVELLTGIGIKDSEIIFTSNKAYGIQGGQNIFDWLKSKILENPYIIYILSENYYKSVACLNEMGASWIIGIKQLALFTPNFDLSSKHFQGGALDPRAIGYHINDEDSVFSFVEFINKDFTIINNNVLKNQKIKKFLSAIESSVQYTITESKSIANIENVDHTSSMNAYEKEVESTETNRADKTELVSKATLTSVKKVNPYIKLKDLLLSKKLKDEEIILLHYAIDNSKFKLMTGWQEDYEIRSIKTWEEVNNITHLLSKGYSTTIERFKFRGFIDVSEITSHGNPKEFSFAEDITDSLLDTESEILEAIKVCIDKNYFDYSLVDNDDDDGLPF